MMETGIFSPIGLPIRWVDDVMILSDLQTEKRQYMGLGEPQLLQIFSTRTRDLRGEGRLSRAEIKELKREVIMEALAEHLDKIGRALEHGQPHEEYVAIEGVQLRSGAPVRTMAGRRWFNSVNPETENLTPGLMALKTRALHLAGPFNRYDFDLKYWMWKSTLALGFKEDGGTWDPKNAFSPDLWHSQLDPREE